MANHITLPQSSSRTPHLLWLWAGLLLLWLVPLNAATKPLNAATKPLNATTTPLAATKLHGNIISFQFAPQPWEHAFLPYHLAQEEKAETESEFTTVITTSEDDDAKVKAGDEITPPSQRIIEDDFKPSFNTFKIAPVRNPNDNRAYQGPRVPVNGRSISLRSYERTHTREDKQRAEERIEQAETYLEAGEIKVFSEILSDIIRQYHFTKEAALAAFHIAQYHEKITPLVAISYYVYVVNLHTYSGYEEEAFFRLGVLLDQEKYYVKSEEILLHSINLIDKRRAKNSAYSSVWREESENYLLRHYQSFARWGEQVGNKKIVQKYQKKEASLLLLKNKATRERLNENNRQGVKKTSYLESK